ncbi:ATP-binding protein [Candidatus Poribacteria bacterium]|jgi:DNA replication protein DnaC|nr:ATP-binding protein [Candidatus Poribacteria bacterium]
MTKLDELRRLLDGLKLRRIAEILDDELAWAEQHGPSYAEVLTRLLSQEHTAQQERFLEHRIRRARLPERWSLGTFPWERQPGVERRVIEQLATLEFIDRGSNIVFIGPTGVGKTGLATGLLLEALFHGRRGLFMKAQDLFDEMYTTLADRSTRKFLNRLIRLDVIVIDEMGYLNLRPEQSNIFFKLMEERYRLQRSTLITTNLDFNEWFEFLGNKSMVGALLDRLRHRCNTITIDGPSLRQPQA